MRESFAAWTETFHLTQIISSFSCPNSSRILFWELRGTPFTEGHGTYDFRFTNIEHVSGACQLFRRECFLAVGGYTPIRGGGIDLVAVVSARMRGWKTRTFPAKVCFHHRKMGSGTNQGLKLPFKWGQKDYRLGGHPVWQLFRCCYQMSKRPYVVGGLLCLTGYFYAFALRRPRDVTPEFVEFCGKEQMRYAPVLLRKSTDGINNCPQV